MEVLKMSHNPSLSYQIQIAINKAFSPGESKRSAKIENHGNLKHKIYSLEEKKSMHDISKNLGNYLQDTYALKNVIDIRTEHLQAWLSEKTYTVADSTLIRYLSALKKIERICNYRYHHFLPPGEQIQWHTDTLILPKSVFTDSYTKDKSMSIEDAQKIINHMKSVGRKSDVWRSVSLSMLTGMRVEETSYARRDRFHFEPGPKGEFGYIEIRKGDGSKGNRPRIVPITNQADQESIKALVFDRSGSEFIIQNSRKKGMHLDKGSITKGFERALNDLGMQEYKGNQNHALRKDWAQRRYDEYRADHEKTETIAYVNTILGHGTKRSVTELKHYCHNIH